MTFERSLGPPETHQPLVAPDPSAGSATPSGGPTPVQIRLQILSTEHWSLLASRSLAWNESFTRASMFLSTLTGSIVALSLIGGVDGFNDAFFVVALVLLRVDLFVGIGTWLRIGASNYHDADRHRGHEPDPRGIPRDRPGPGPLLRHGRPRRRGRSRDHHGCPAGHSPDRSPDRRDSSARHGPECDHRRCHRRHRRLSFCGHRGAGYGRPGRSQWRRSSSPRN